MLRGRFIPLMCKFMNRRFRLVTFRRRSPPSGQAVPSTLCGLVLLGTALAPPVDRGVSKWQLATKS
jgi:hypothetical protein